VDKVDATKEPALVKLKDLLGHKVKGQFYTAQLRPAPTPGVDYQFEVIRSDFFVETWLNSYTFSTNWNLKTFVMKNASIFLSVSCLQFC
jgi:hypothetical protein